MIPLSLGELFGGSNGMQCSKCPKKTWLVWLTQEENDLLKNSERDPRLIVCEQKLGVILCSECGE